MRGKVRSAHIERWALTSAVIAACLSGCTDAHNTPYDTTVSQPGVQVFSRAARTTPGSAMHDTSAVVIVPDGFGHMNVDWSYTCPPGAGGRRSGMDIELFFWNQSLLPESPNDRQHEFLHIVVPPSSGSWAFDLKPNNPTMRVRITPRDPGCTWRVTAMVR
ncbi:MAG: hypothetical protein NVS4B2_27640 [Chloroflexota bacterium]